MDTKLYSGLPCLIFDDYAIVFSPYKKSILRVDNKALDGEYLQGYLHENGFSGQPSACAGSKSDLYQLTIILTSDCNLRCKYCFVKGGVDKQVIQFDMIQSAIEKAIVNAKRRNKKGILITFFGGEPTLELNLIKKAVDYSRDLCLKNELVAKYGITTNGVFNTEIAEYLSEQNFFITISSDGVPEIQDLQRVFSNGKGSAEYVRKTIKYFVEHKANVLVRMTVTEKSVDYLPQSVKYFADLGVRIIHIEVVSIAGRAVEMKGSVNRPTKEKFAEKLIESIKLAKSLGISIMNSAYMNIFTPSVHFCDGVGGNKLVVTYNGEFTTCLEVQDNCHPVSDDFIIGNCGHDKIQNSRFLDRPIVDVVDECKECFAKYICSGGCPTRNYHMEGNVYRVDQFRCYIIRELLKYVINEMYLNADGSK